MLDVGNLLRPIPTAPQHNTLRNQGSNQNLSISPLGAPHELGGDVEPLSLDLQTFRAFQREEQIVDAWNKDMHILMKRSDQEKRGELKIGVALPSVVESVLGEGGAGLKVSGSRQIRFSGRSQWSDVTNTAVQRQSKFPSLTMDQVSRFTVEGTVGSKVFVKVDQDSRRQTDLENRIQLRYKGDEDDILQTVEAGNTTLSLPNTRFVGYSQAIQGLFGLKATAQLGPVDFTMITSQEKGNSVRNRYTAGSEEKAVYVRDYSYAAKRIFDLGVVRDPIGDTLIRFLGPNGNIVYFELYESTSNEGELGAQSGRAFTYFPNRSLTGLTDSVMSTFKRVGDQTPYTYESNKDGWYLLFQQSNASIINRTYAYYLRFVQGSDTLEVGSKVGDTLKLQLLTRPGLDANNPLWDAEWKNVYDLTVRGIDYDNLSFNIYKGAVGTENSGINLDHQGEIPYLQLLGLDKTNVSGDPDSPDNKIDNDPAILDLASGLLIFPDRRPFDSDIGRSPRYPDSLLDPRVPSIYNSGNEQDKRNNSKYYLQIQTRSRSTKISLGRVNILPESETITFNGYRLNRGTDYNIDYDIGQVTFINDRVLDPNGQLDIDYEYSPFLSVEKKTLFGLRSEYAPSQNFHTGATFLFKGSKATDRPAQLGQEPFRDLVLDYDVYWKTSPKFFTSLANAVPLVETESPSSLTLAAEVARSMPNPNTRGEVFIDDFESARLTYSLGILREVWDIASPPAADSAATFHRPQRGLYDPAMIWYNPYTQFNITDIYNRELENQSDNRQHVLVLKFDPTESILKDSVPGGDLDQVWGGIMRGLPRGVWDQSRSETLELRMAVRTPANPADLGMMHIDLGKITEDVNQDGIWNTEDQIRGGVRNGLLDIDQGEDTGLDGIPDAEEVSPDGTPYDPVTNPDPAGDNWDFDPDDQVDVQHINGTEGNSKELLGGYPDSEDLGGINENNLDLDDDYYSFTIDLANPGDKLVANTEKYDSDHNLTWNTYRIPLWGEFADAIVRKPDSSINIQYARIWFDGAEGPNEVYIAAIDLVQNKWLGDIYPLTEVPDSTDTGTDWHTLISPAAVARDEKPKFRVAVKNTETDPIYNPPPGVKGYKAPGSNAREKEQALSLEYVNFVPGDTGRAILDSRNNQDYTGYRYLKLYMHGANDGLPTNADSASVFYLKFGQDSLNYYLYQDTIRTGLGDDAWAVNDISIDFDRITAFKEQVRLAHIANASTEPIDTLDAETHYGVRGLPSLQFISYMEMGVIRTDARGDAPHSSEIWLDELRLTDVRKDQGTAGRVAVTAQFADLVNVAATVEGQNYAFRSLTAGRTGSVVNQSSSLNQDYRGSISLDKFVPQSLGLSLPVSLSYQKRTATPKLLTGSDVVLTKELREPHISESVTKGFSTSIRLNPRNAGWLFRSTIGGLSGNFSTSKSESRSYTVPHDENEQYSASAGYSLRVNKRPSFPALFWTRFLLMPRRVWGTQFTLLPNDFSANGSVTRNYGRRLNSDSLLTISYSRLLSGTANGSYSPIPALRVNYSMTTRRDIARPEEINLSISPRKFRLGRELQYSQRFDGNYKPTLFNWLAPTFTFSTDFNDKIDPTLRDHDINRNRRMSVNTTLDPDKVWAFLRGDDSGKKRPGRSRAPSRVGPSRRKLQEENQDKDSSAKQDSTAAEVKQEGGGGGIGPMDLWRGLISGFSLLTSPIEPLSVTLSRTNGDVKSNLADRPRFAYLFGLSDTVYVASRDGVKGISSVDNTSQSDALTVKNNIRVLRFLTFSSGYTWGASERHQQTSDNWAKSVTFPDLSTSLGQIEKVIPFRWLFTNATAKTGYSAKVDSAWAGSQDLPPTNVTKTSGFSPLISITGTTKRGVRLNFVTDHTTSTNEPDTGQRQRRKSSSWRLTLDYTFRSPNGLPLPLLRSIRISSQMAVSLAIGGRSSSTETAAPGEGYQQTNTSNEFSVSPRANYSFSSRVKGGMSAEWRDTKDYSAGSPRKSHVRELALWVEFSF